MANMTFEDVAQIFRDEHILYDLREDIDFYNENISALQSGNISLMRERLEKTINKYRNSIDQLSMFTKVTRGSYTCITCDKIYSDLTYVTRNIPLYVAFDKLKEFGLEFLLKKFLSDDSGVAR
jgi:hypothetical protein